MKSKWVCNSSGGNDFFKLLFSLKLSNLKMHIQTQHQSLMQQTRGAWTQFLCFAPPSGQLPDNSRKKQHETWLLVAFDTVSCSCLCSLPYVCEWSPNKAKVCSQCFHFDVGIPCVYPDEGLEADRRENGTERTKCNGVGGEKHDSVLHCVATECTLGNTGYYVLGVRERDQRVKLCSSVCNILNWGSGGFSVYCADVLMAPAGIDAPKWLRVCCDCVCEWALSRKNAYACKFVSVWDGRLGGFLYETDAVMKSDNKGAIHNLRVTRGVNRALAGLAHTQTHSYKDAQTNKQAQCKHTHERGYKQKAQTWTDIQRQIYSLKCLRQDTHNHLLLAHTHTNSEIHTGPEGWISVPPLGWVLPWPSMAPQGEPLPWALTRSLSTQATKLTPPHARSQTLSVTYKHTLNYNHALTNNWAEKARDRHGLNETRNNGKPGGKGSCCPLNVSCQQPIDGSLRHTEPLCPLHSNGSPCVALISHSDWLHWLAGLLPKAV